MLCGCAMVFCRHGVVPIRKVATTAEATGEALLSLLSSQPQACACADAPRKRLEVFFRPGNGRQLVAGPIVRYFDFSAYSDMAIGLGRIFGFHFIENFRYPYVSRSNQGARRRGSAGYSSRRRPAST